MIFAVGHVACSFPDNAAFIKRCVENGYAVDVSERGLENLDVKRRLLTHFPCTHDITRLTMPGAVPLEVLDHGATYGEGFLSRKSPTEFIVRTKDLAASMSFWTRLGFARDGEASVRFSSPFNRASLSLEFELSQYARLPMLDDAGFNAVAMVSSSAPVERESLLGVAAVTQIGSLRVGGNALDLFFARNPLGGEIVEVYSLKPGGASEMR